MWRMTKLSEYLERHTESQLDFGQRVQLHQSVVSRFSKGLAKPSLETAFKIERATNGEVPASSWVSGQ